MRTSARRCARRATRSWRWRRRFPGPVAPRPGWGNRDERPARLPRTDRLVHTLDDLENLWDVPRPDRARFASAIEPLLDHPEPMVRAAAAACLGRLGQPSSVEPLVARLADPSKIVWRAAAWALAAAGQPGDRPRRDRRGTRQHRSGHPARGRADLRLPVLRDG